MPTRPDQQALDSARMVATVEAIEAIHWSRRNWREEGNQDQYQDVCNECGQLWPCRTKRILTDG
jgi:hypothetical protein